MWKRMKWILSVATFLGIVGIGADASAQCCPGYEPAVSCQGVTLTKSRWCVQSTVPTGNNTITLPTEFCPYGDEVVSYLELLFDLPAPSIFEFELDTQTGGAHTGTACTNFGDGTAYDAFKGGTSYYGWLLPLHEGINDWTGMSSPGWPTDWWADHISAFPNWADYRIMLTIGTNTMSQDLLSAATTQYGNFWPGGSRPDPRVQMFDAIYLLPGFSFGGYTHMMQMQQGDQVIWDNLGVPNPDEKRSEYVLAYMSLAAGRNLLPMAQNATICDNTQDGSGDPTYTCQKTNIDAIASAHCGIKANGNPPADIAAIDTGNYNAVKAGTCNSSCTDECACKSSTMQCVPRWLSDSYDGGVPQTVQPDAGSLGSAGSSGGSSSGATSSSGVGSSSGAANASGATSGAGSAGSSGPNSTASGSPSPGTASGVGMAESGNGGAATGGGSNAAKASPTGGACVIARAKHNDSGTYALSALVGFAFTRARLRRR